MTATTAVVFPAGDPPGPAILDDLPDDAWIIAADGGADHARRLGLCVDLVVGDLDSVTPATLDALGDGTVVDRHPSDKESTDLELALDHVLRRSGITSVIVVGGLGGRFDHLLGNVAVLCAPRFSELGIVWLAEDARATVVHDHARLHGHPRRCRLTTSRSEADARGVTTSGLRSGTRR